MSYTTYLFDFDYTLADSSRGIVICFRNVLIRHGYTEITDDDIKRTIGKTLEDSFSLLTGITDAEQLAILKAEYSREADIYMTVNTVLFEETQAVLTILKERGAQLGIISTKYRFRIHELLNQHFPENFFDIIVGGEDVTEHKPSPEGLLSAINELHCAREETLYIGDGTIDAETAQAAGIDFAGVTHGVTTATELSEYPHVKVMSSLEELLDDNEAKSTLCNEEKTIDKEKDIPSSHRGEKRINIGQSLILLLLLFLSIRELITEDSLILFPIFLLVLWGVLQKRRILPLRMKTTLTSRFHRCLVRLRAFHIKIIRGKTPPSICNETSICRNCGTTYIGNYCNRCGQSHNTPRYNVGNALRHIVGGFLNIDNGFGHTLIDLLHRPGYMISDFIGGKRISYFRPFQTLFVLAAIHIMIVQLIDPEALSKKNIFKLQENHYAATATVKKTSRNTDSVLLNMTEATNDTASSPSPKITDTKNKISQLIRQSPFVMRIWNLLKSWMQGNKAFHIIVTLPLFAMSTRFVFRHKRYNPKYNITEHIFIQTYIACQFLLLSIIVLPLHGYAKIDKLYDLPLWCLFALFCWDYKQLYRSSWWSSFWRTAQMFLYSSLLLILIAMAVTLAAIIIFDV